VSGNVAVLAVVAGQHINTSTHEHMNKSTQVISTSTHRGILLVDIQEKSPMLGQENVSHKEVV
jgi:hypothetical protein